ncbi:hypothetical protein TNCV_473081 [Trichonephila clavipes]|nr:hypothetical protein TNCV_473081 [Trichonephila clavipes]
MPSLPVPTDDVVSRVFIESSSLELVVTMTVVWQASFAATPSRWRYTSKTSCPVVRRKRASASALFRYLGIEPTVTRVSHGFPKLFGLRS